MSRFILCSFALVLLYPTAIDLYLVGLPQISADLNATESQLHIAFSIYLAGMATTMLIAGNIADSIGRKPVAILGAMIFIAASLLAGNAQHSSWFLFARFIQGVGAGSCYVVAFAILRDTLSETQRAKVLTMINGITCIVPVLAPVLGYLIMLRYPWQSLFTTMAIMGFMVLLLMVLLLKESKPHFPSLTTQQSSHLSAETFAERFFVSRLIITSLGVTTILTYVNTSPLIIMGEMGFDRQGYSIIMALTALVSMITSFSAPFILSRLKQNTLMVTAQCLFAFAAVILFLTQQLHLANPLYFLGFASICAGFSISFGVSMSQALGPFSRRAGVASSLLAIAQIACSAFYIWIMGILAVSAFNMLIFILISGSVISFALLLLLPQPSHSEQHEKIISPS